MRNYFHHSFVAFNERSYDIRLHSIDDRVHSPEDFTWSKIATVKEKLGRYGIGIFLHYFQPDEVAHGSLYGLPYIIGDSLTSLYFDNIVSEQIESGNLTKQPPLLIRIESKGSLVHLSFARKGSQY